jgi:hypothetical protein
MTNHTNKINNIMNKNFKNIEMNNNIIEMNIDY